MIKLANTNNEVFVKLTIPEFKYLAQVADVNDVPDGNNVSLTWIKDIIDNVTNFQVNITAAKLKAEELAVALGTMII